MIRLTHWPSLDAKRAGNDWHPSSWDQVFERLSERAEFQGKFDHPGWSPAEFKPLFREAAHVQNVSALCLDYDHGETIDAAVHRLSAHAGGFLHTSRSHTDDAHRFRVVLPLARPVSAFEYPELWKRVAPVVGSIDEAPKDASRFWYLPGSAGGPFETRQWDGAWLDPSAWLAKPDPTAPVAPLARTIPLSQDGARVEDRARKYLAAMPASIAGQGGDAALWNAAFVLVCGFGLSEERAFAILREDFNPRCEPPWEMSRLQYKAKSASKKARAERGYLLRDEGSSWLTSRHRVPAQPPEDDGFVSEPPDGFVDVEETPAPSAEDEPLREPGADDEKPAEESKTQSATERYGVIELQSLLFQVFEEAKKGKRQIGFTTGHWELDALLGGLRRKHVTLLAASTSWGKSSWGVMVADENIKARVPTLVVSVEDPDMMYGKRIAARRAGVNAMKLRDNDCDLEVLTKLNLAAMGAEPEPFFLPGIGKSVEWIAQAIKELVAERGIGLVICDYVQRFRTRQFAGDRRNQVTYVAETLSDAIKMSGAAGVLLSQLKRIEGREPTMDDVKESGDLENMAEHVLLGYKTKEAYVAGDTRWKRFILCPKNKDGPTTTGKLELPFNEFTANFETIEDPKKNVRQAEMYDEEQRRHA